MVVAPLRTARTAVVTGAGRGIGAAVARGLAARGYEVALLGRTEAHLRTSAQEILAEQPESRVHVIPVDLVDAQQVRSAARAAEDALGSVDLLVQNAGVVEHDELPFAEDDVEDVWRVVEANLRGPMLLAHALLPGMLAVGGGRMVHVNSGSGYRASGVYTGYHVSKGALARFTTQLDAQYRARGLVVLDVAPGVVATDMTAGMPTHSGRTEWTPVEEMVALVAAVGDGELDALAGRFVRAGADTVASLHERTEQILATGARRLTLSLWGDDDPLR
ncbi:SDR family oxidoreductase [Isoptericola sp. b441]|uniref:SDR family oxidoreductase n=1 Tax=Actinotalea lenta TaxID=3064654 RepID=A0ABT9D8V8_9CELL|nr:MULTISPECIES: SDR family oxidoreductase [unclassified Isoptericola]MDO8106568.1 SDR family oxidoreductase [Isoptericola sp. b441]MDO8121724.1 SDR family oxidoreductase [Isoptericola sp. b490]